MDVSKIDSSVGVDTVADTLVPVPEAASMVVPEEVPPTSNSNEPILAGDPL